MADPVTDPAQATPEAGADPAAQPPADPKAGDPPAAPIVPEKYELKLPEGSLLDPSTIEKISAYAKEKGLSNEAAQEALERESEAVASHHEAQMKQVEDIRAGWVKDCETDKEIGGENFKQNVELASRLLEKVNPAIKPLLNESGLGNHPEIVRTVVRLVKMTGFSEDQFINPGAKTSGVETNGPDDIAAKMYPSMVKQ